MTFADLSFILMCFFALQISFSKANKQQFENVVQGMVQTPLNKAPEDSLQSLKEKLDQQIKKKQLSAQAEVRLDTAGVAIEFRDKMLFAAGSAQINRKTFGSAAAVMATISKAAKKYRVSIEGHTDDSPLVGHRRFRSNWELSAARGISLLKFFEKNGVATEQLRVIAYGSTRPKIPIIGLAPTELAAARAQNRRVVIRLE